MRRSVTRREHSVRDADEPTQLEHLEDGDLVQHIGTRRWAEILSIHPQHDGTCELMVRDIEHGDRAWASYHVADHRPSVTP